jgi:heat shock protein 4
MEREGISRSLQETEEWLYEDGDDETENAYTAKMQDLKKVITYLYLNLKFSILPFS